MKPLSAALIVFAGALLILGSLLAPSLANKNGKSVEVTGMAVVTVGVVGWLACMFPKALKVQGNDEADE